MNLAKLITADRIRVPLESTEKIGVITELIDVLAQTNGLIDRDIALEAVLKREAERTTGIGYGLAIPHGKSDGCKSLVMAAGKPRDPVDFQSLDGRPVTFVVLLVSPPDQTGPHIQALAKISRLMNIDEFRAAVAAATTSEALFEAISSYDTTDSVL
ncbi:MAG: PTS sugar transporter subunit IIA [Phycisphaerae bacterium]|nr:PTS sugar transporter subunit IIA [Phycisphaerae bacterium]